MNTAAFDGVGIIESMLAALILAAAGALYRLLYRFTYRQYGFVTGSWFGHLLMSDQETLVVHRMVIKYGFLPFRPLRLSLTEVTKAEFRSSGHAHIRGNFLFAYLSGETHRTCDFLACKIPFNRTDRLDYMSGILSGVTQKDCAAATFIIFSRSSMDIESVRKEYPAKGAPLLVDNLPTQVRARIL